MNFLNLDIYNGKYDDFLNLLKNSTKKTLVFTPNPEILLRASKDEWFLGILRQATYNTPDGNWLYVGSLIQEGKSFLSAWFSLFFQKKQIQKKYGELIKGSDLTSDLFDFAQKSGKRILIIDIAPIIHPVNEFEKKKKEIQKKMLPLLKEKFPSLLCDIMHNWDHSDEEIAHTIKEKDTQFVFCSLGMKKQEEKLVRVFSHLPDDQKVTGLWVGASVDFLLWLQKRAPVFFQKLGLEWLYRFFLEPRKRWVRIWDALYHFPKQVKKSSHSL